MRIRPAKYLRGEVALPGDKSISHRAAIIAAMAEGESRIHNFATSADCASTLRCLRQLGVGVRKKGTTVWITGVGKSGLRAPVGPLDCGNSGTTMRLLAGVLAGQGFSSVLVGDQSLQSRPMRRVIEPLTEMGATIDSTDGRAPLTINGSDSLRGIEYKPPVASAQIKSGVLLAGLNADGWTTIVEPVPTRDHTERMLRWFGAEVEENDDDGHRKISVSGDAVLGASDLAVPADISASAFFIVAAASLPESEIVLRNVGLNPTRAAVIGVLRDGLGADIRIENQREENNESIGDIFVTGTRREPSVNEISGRLIPNLIDELPILAVYGTQLESGLVVRDAAELRVKETDRIAATTTNLERMGAAVEEFDDGFRVARSKLQGATVGSFGDHRIVMTFAVAGLLAEGETAIDGAECAAVSFPEFFEVLESVVNHK